MLDVLLNFNHIQEICLRFWRLPLTLCLHIHHWVHLLVILIHIPIVTLSWHLRLIKGLHWYLSLMVKLEIKLWLIWIIHRYLRLVLRVILIILSTSFYITNFLLFKLWLTVKSIKLRQKIINIIRALLFFVYLLSWNFSLSCIIWIIRVSS